MPVMSMGFLVEPDQAVIWRGPMLHGSINQFLGETEWGELDYLIIDMPPGTGDVALTLVSSFAACGCRGGLHTSRSRAARCRSKRSACSERSTFRCWEWSKT